MQIFLYCGMAALFIISSAGAVLAQDAVDMTHHDEIALEESVETMDHVAPAEEVAPLEEAVLTEETVPTMETASTETIVTKSDDSESVRIINPATRFPRGLQLGAGVSVTSGFNGFIGYANKNFDSFWWKRFGVRFDFATIAPVRSSINSALNSAVDDGLEINELTLVKFDFKAKHYGALVDFYPFGNTWFLGGLRVSGGYMNGTIGLGANLAGGMGSDPSSFELNGVGYRYNGGGVSGAAKVDWNYRGPYLGTGFDLGLFFGIKIYADVGVVFTSRTPGIALNVPITDTLQVESTPGVWQNVLSNPSHEAAFKANKNTALKGANDELGDIKFYPMVKLGFMYRF